MYLILVALTATSWILSPEFASGGRRIFIGSLAGGLVVLAASLLTRMHLAYLASIERLEASKNST
jgi:hypothetical protein